MIHKGQDENPLLSYCHRPTGGITHNWNIVNCEYCLRLALTPPWWAKIAIIADEVPTFAVVALDPTPIGPDNYWEAREALWGLVNEC